MGDGGGGAGDERRRQRQSGGKVGGGVSLSGDGKEDPWMEVAREKERGRRWRSEAAFQKRGEVQE